MMTVHNFIAFQLDKLFVSHGVCLCGGDGDDRLYRTVVLLLLSATRKFVSFGSVSLI